MDLQIPKGDKLSPAEKEIEAQFSAAVQKKLELFVAQYIKRFGRVIDTDRARELCPAYKESPAARTRWSRAVYHPAKALVDEIYKRMVREPVPAGGRSILFTSGGTGVGKSTALAQMHGDDIPPEERYDIVVDGTLSDLPAASAKIRLALALGHRVTVVHVHRDFDETLRMVVRRAIEMGRAVTLDNIAATHFRSRETLFALVEEFGEEIEVRVLENSSDHDARPVSLASLETVPGKTVDELRERAHALYRHEFAHLEASHPQIHRAFKQPGSRR